MPHMVPPIHYKYTLMQSLSRLLLIRIQTSFGTSHSNMLLFHPIPARLSQRRDDSSHLVPVTKEPNAEVATPIAYALVSSGLL